MITYFTNVSLLYFMTYQKTRKIKCIRSD